MTGPRVSACRRVAAWLLAAGVSIFVGATAAPGHPPLPATVLDPRTTPEAWNVLRLCTSNVDRLLSENRLAEIPDQVSLCSPALHALVRFAPTGQRAAVARCAVRAGAEVGSVAQSGMAGDRATAVSTFAALRTDLRELAASFDLAAVNAEIYFCPMHPDFLRTDPAARCERCGMSLQPRRIPYSFIYAAPGEPTLRLALSAGPALAAGRESRVTMRLTQSDGAPVNESELMVMHTRPIHLLIVNPALEDYQHIHPTPGKTPGEYVFPFTPARDSAYRVFADIVPFATGVQEFPFADLPGPIAPAGRTPPHGENTVTSEAGGLRFVLSDAESNNLPLRARQTRNILVTVSEAGGKPVGRLEPVMNAFAHLVGFYDDGRTVLHIHPEGGEVVNPAVRGGPSLEFRFYAPKPGFVRLFCQVQVDGMEVYAPFNVNVLP